MGPFWNWPSSVPCGHHVHWSRLDMRASWIRQGASLTLSCVTSRSDHPRDRVTEAPYSIHEAQMSIKPWSTHVVATHTTQICHFQIDPCWQKRRRTPSVIIVSLLVRVIIPTTEWNVFCWNFVTSGVVKNLYLISYFLCWVYFISYRFPCRPTHFRTSQFSRNKSLPLVSLVSCHPYVRREISDSVLKIWNGFNLVWVHIITSRVWQDHVTDGAVSKGWVLFGANLMIMRDLARFSFGFDYLLVYLFSEEKLR